MLDTSPAGPRLRCSSRGGGPVFRELSVAEQRYQAVLAVIEGGLQITEAAAKAGVTRQALREWLTRYAEGGLEALADRSHRPRSCPHEMDPAVEVRLVELRGLGRRSAAVSAGARGRGAVAVPGGDRPGAGPFWAWSARAGGAVRGGSTAGGSAGGRWSCGSWT